MTASTASQRTLLGHPIGLFVLFFTEMWERFSYYGMRALLTLYMTDYLLIRPELGREVFGYNWLVATLTGVFGPLETQALASQIYGLYTGFVYFTPFFGGIIADRVLGQRKTVYVGGILMAIGHFLMAIQSMFFVALLFLIVGNGAFKPNISTQVGALYPESDPRRDGAYTIYYMGINLGAFLAPLVCGTLGQKVGWHWGFGAAGVGMIIGLLVYFAGRNLLAPDNITQTRSEGPKQPLTSDEWKRVGALVVLCALNIVFWGVYEQQGNTLQLWADDRTNWHILGMDLPSTWYQSFNPAMIFMAAPLLNVYWAWRARHGASSSSVTKMAIGCFLLGASFIVMIIAARTVPVDVRASVLWLALTTLIFTLGELYLSPIGLSLVTKVAPARIVSMMMGMWFLSSFFGNYLSGYLGMYYERMAKDEFFLMLTALGVGAGAMMLLFNRPLRRAIGHEV